MITERITRKIIWFILKVVNYLVNFPRNLMAANQLWTVIIVIFGGGTDVLISHTPMDNYLLFAMLSRLWRRLWVLNYVMYGCAKVLPRLLIDNCTIFTLVYGCLGRMFGFFKGAWVFWEVLMLNWEVRISFLFVSPHLPPQFGVQRGFAISNYFFFLKLFLNVQVE